MIKIFGDATRSNDYIPPQNLEELKKRSRILGAALPKIPAEGYSKTTVGLLEKSPILQHDRKTKEIIHSFNKISKESSKGTQLIKREVGTQTE